MMISLNEIRDVFDWLVTSVFGGIILMLLGAAILIWSVIKPTRKVQIRGLIGALMLILVGVWAIYNSIS